MEKEEKSQDPTAVIALDFDGVISLPQSFCDFLNPQNNNDIVSRKRIVSEIKANIRKAFAKKDSQSAGVVVTGSIHEGEDTYAFWCTDELKKRLLASDEEAENDGFYNVFTASVTSTQLAFIDNIPLLRVYLESFSRNDVRCFPATNRLSNAAVAQDKDFLQIEVALTALNNAFGVDRAFLTLAQSTNIISSPSEAAQDTEASNGPPPKAAFTAKLNTDPNAETNVKKLLLETLQEAYRTNLSSLPKTNIYFLDDMPSHIGVVRGAGYTAIQISQEPGETLLDQLEILAGKLLPQAEKTKLDSIKLKAQLETQKEIYSELSQQADTLLFDSAGVKIWKVQANLDIADTLELNAGFLAQLGAVDEANQLLSSTVEIYKAVNEYVAANQQNEIAKQNILKETVNAALGIPDTGANITQQINTYGAVNAVFELINWLGQHAQELGADSPEKRNAITTLTQTLRTTANAFFLKPTQENSSFDFNGFLCKAQENINQELQIQKKDSPLHQHRNFWGRIWSMFVRKVLRIQNSTLGASNTEKHLRQAHGKLSMFSSTETLPMGNPETLTPA